MNMGERLRDLVIALVDEASTRPRPGQITRRQAIVTAVNAGPPKTVTLKFYATDPTGFPSRHLSSYAPTQGDVVWVDFMGPDPMVIGKLA